MCVLFIWSNGVLSIWYNSTVASSACAVAVVPASPLVKLPMVDEDNVPILTNGEMLTIPRAGMIKHHQDLGKLREEEMMRFRTKADQGPYQPDTASRLSKQIEDIKKANENR